MCAVGEGISGGGGLRLEPAWRLRRYQGKAEMRLIRSFEQKSVQAVGGAGITYSKINLTVKSEGLRFSMRISGLMNSPRLD